jgi:hypothetical protein
MKKIDKVTTTNLDLAMRMAGIYIDLKTIDKIIDIVELVEEKGDDTSVRDICKLQAEWDWDKEADAIINTENIQLEDLVKNEWYVLEDEHNKSKWLFKFLSWHIVNGESPRVNYTLMLNLSKHRDEYKSNFHMNYNASFDTIRKAPKELVLDCFPNELLPNE